MSELTLFVPLSSGQRRTQHSVDARNVVAAHTLDRSPTRSGRGPASGSARGARTETTPTPSSVRQLEARVQAGVSRERLAHALRELADDLAATRRDNRDKQCQIDALQAKSLGC